MFRGDDKNRPEAVDRDDLRRHATAPADARMRNQLCVNVSGRRTTTGFSLIEIMVVVVIVGIISAIAIPNLVRARIATNEQLALNSLRLLSKSCHFFYSVHQSFPADLTELGPPVSDPSYVDSSLIIGNPPTRQGYQFVYSTPVNRQTFILLANPELHATTGVRHFYIDNTLFMTATDQNQDATAADPTIQ